MSHWRVTSRSEQAQTCVVEALLSERGLYNPQPRDGAEINLLDRRSSRSIIPVLYGLLYRRRLHLVVLASPKLSMYPCTLESAFRLPTISKSEPL